jgi:hypothetical protein
MNTTLRIAMSIFVFLGLTLPVYASNYNIDPNIPHCLTDNANNYYQINIFHADSGQMIIFGHVHHLAFTKDHPCYTQDLTGSGRLYTPEQNAPGDIANFTVETIDARPWCPYATATLSGSVNNNPVVYTGTATLKQHYFAKPQFILDYSLTLVSCETHP